MGDRMLQEMIATITEAAKGTWRTGVPCLRLLETGPLSQLAITAASNSGIELLNVFDPAVSPQHPEFDDDHGCLPLPLGNGPNLGIKTAP